MAALVEINLEPSDKLLRQFGFIAFFAFGSLAVWAFRAAYVRAACALAVLAVLCALSSFAYPRANRPLYVALTVAVFPLGWIASYVLLGALFYFVIGPVALGVRLFASDPMQRKFDRGAKSYFVTRAKQRTKASYFRQF